MIELDEVDSTNSYLRRLDAAEGCPMMLVTADYQSAGRGADTNRWESARGENLLLSLRVEPANLPISRMFALSEATALSLAKALTSFLEGQGAGEGARSKEQGAGEGARGKEQGAGEYNLAQQSPCPSPLAPCPLPLFRWRWSILLISVLLSAADYVYFYSLSLDGALVSVVSMVRRSSVVVSFMLGALLFREKNLRSKAIDLALVLLSMLLLWLGRE